jgi:hypothetical protein
MWVGVMMLIDECRATAVEINLYVRIAALRVASNDPAEHQGI